MKANHMPPIQKALLLVWPLMLGVSLIMTGNGLQGTLLGLRANMADFPVYATGIIMSLYYCGYVLGCWIVPNMISSVGHVRVFAALASVASTTILLHGLFVNPWLWGIVRIVSGIGFAGMFIVAESWLNNIATNKLRGKIFSIYIFVVYAGLFSGQFLINLAPLDQMGLFVLISVLVSLSLLPVTLANKPAPGYEAPEKLPFWKSIRSSPMAMVSVFGSGICSGSVLGIGSVYASEIGMNTSQVALFIAFYIAGSALLPLFTGWLSDFTDRRRLLIVLSLFATLGAASVPVFDHLYIVVFMFGGLTTSIYSIAIAYMNDQIKPEQVLSATTTLILVNGFGACLGPLLLGAGIQYIGPPYFFYALAGANAMIFVMGIFRTVFGDPVVVEEQTDFVNIPARSSPAVAEIGEVD